MKEYSVTFAADYKGGTFIKNMETFSDSEADAEKRAEAELLEMLPFLRKLNLRPISVVEPNG